MSLAASALMNKFEGKVDDKQKSHIESSVKARTEKLTAGIQLSVRSPSDTLLKTPAKRYKRL